MATKTITYAVCEKCGDVLYATQDGLVFHGPVYLSGPQHEADAPGATAPIIGPRPGVRSRDHSNETALCWGCFRALAPDPKIKELTAELEKARESVRYHVEQAWEQNERERGPTGPLPPPELPTPADVGALR